MAIEIEKLIAAVSPDTYCSPAKGKEVKRLAQKRGYLVAAREAIPVEGAPVDLQEIEYSSPFSLIGLQAPTESHVLVYDSPTTYLHRLYLWLVDYLESRLGVVDKILDNLDVHPGAGGSQDPVVRADKIQERMGKILDTGYRSVKDLLDIVSDLKRMKLLLTSYTDLDSDKDEVRNNALRTLKKHWLNVVDIKRGDMALNRLSQQADKGYLREAFMADTHQSRDQLGLPPDTHSFLEERMRDFLDWMKESGLEIGTRFDLERIRLRNQVEKVKIAGRRLNPYLLKVSPKPHGNLRAELSSAFSTAHFNAVLLGRSRFDIFEAVERNELPKSFKSKKLRDYFSVVFISINARLIPKKQGKGTSYSGRSIIHINSFALNWNEYRVIMKEIDQDFLADALKTLGGISTERISQINVDIRDILEEHSEDGPRPSFSLLSLFGFDREMNIGVIDEDSSSEKVIRSLASIEARKACREMYEGMKEALGMIELPEKEDG